MLYFLDYVYNSFQFYVYLFHQFFHLIDVKEKSYQEKVSFHFNFFPGDFDIYSITIHFLYINKSHLKFYSYKHSTVSKSYLTPPSNQPNFFLAIYLLLLLLQQLLVLLRVLNLVERSHNLMKKSNNKAR